MPPAFNGGRSWEDLCSFTPLFSTEGGVGAKDVWDAGDLHLVTSSATNICLHLQHSLQRSMSMLDLDQNVGFSPCLAFVLELPPALPFSVPGCWLPDSVGNLCGLGGVSGDPRPCFPYFFCPCPYTLEPGALPFQSFLAHCLYCGVLCAWVVFFRCTVCACSSQQWGPA